MRRGPIRYVAFVGIALIVAGPALGTSPVIAAASGRAPDSMGPAPHNVGASQLTLAQAPMGLQVAVQSALGGLSGSRQQAKLAASDGAAGDIFGFSVAISGSTAVVGAYVKNSYTGAAYVFVRSGERAWTQQAKLTASDAASGDNFGRSVAIFNSTALVGAYTENSSIGAAYVFVRSGTTWSQQAKLTASDGGCQLVCDEFGGSVAISGSTAVVGAVGKDSNTGAAYMFVRSGTAWSQQAKLTASDGAADHRFGFSVAISGSTAVVAAMGGSTYTGAAYVFVRSGKSWPQQAELTAPSTYVFGSAVAISGSTLLVGAYGQNFFMGAAYVFVRSGTTWTRQAELTASDAASNDQFGISVAISGSTAMVGASGYAIEAAYVFVRSGTVWSQQSKFTEVHRTGQDYFGFSVALSGSTAVVGAFGKDSNTGAAYVYRLR